jgi:uncharacterized protein YyaL (SSP411 family)
MENFYDIENELFYYTNKDQSDVVIRKKEIYDGAVPSGNAIMAWNLLYLAIIYDNQAWKGYVEEMLKRLIKAITIYPTSFGAWAGVLYRHICGVNEIVIVGNDYNKLHNEILHIFIPNRILQLSDRENNEFPLLKGKNSTDKPLIFLCKDYVCQAPVDNVQSLIRHLENKIIN